jgi:alkylhydroperoxidase family enzyme
MPRKPKHPRTEPLEPPYDEATAAALQLLGPPIQLFRVFARRPERARGIAGWGHYYLSRKSALSLRHRELVIDRTTARCGADYEWGIHVAAFAKKAGLSDDQLLSLANGCHTDPCWLDPGDRAVLGAVDELHGSHDLSDEAWMGLVDTIGQEGALEVTLICGWYHAISYAVRALRLPLEPGTAPIPI